MTYLMMAPQIQKQIELAFKLEVVSIGCLSCFELEARIDATINSYFKNLFFQVHQNVLCFAQSILAKLSPALLSANKWADRLN